MRTLNKYFLQYMLCNGAINMQDGNALLNKFANKLDENQIDIKSVIAEINEQISQQLLQIHVRTCEVSGEKMCTIINKKTDDINQSLLNYSAAEIELFDNIITALMTSDSKCISSILCLNLTSRMKNSISKDDAQERIDNWSQNGYLVKDDGFVYLGPRTISEFEVFLRENFPGRITTCSLCTDFVYFGKICAECSEVFHKHCLGKHLSKVSKCPSCKRSWSETQGRNYDDDDDQENSDNAVDTE